MDDVYGHELTNSIVKIQSFARGARARQASFQMGMEASKQEWVRYHLACGEYDKARELGWDGEEPERKGEDCIIS